jgi:hypothetical protein
MTHLRFAATNQLLFGEGTFRQERRFVFSSFSRLPGMCFNQPMSFMFAGELLRPASQGITDDSSSNGLDDRDLHQV